jgi:hypothetical protein
MAYTKPKDFLKLPENKWSEFEQKVQGGKNFGDNEVQRAIAAGYTLDDVNSYLKERGVTPQGSFAVAGFNEYTSRSTNTPNEGYTSGSPQKDPFYRYVGSLSIPKSQGDGKTEPAKEAPTTQTATSAAGTPELTAPGVNLRLLGQNMGIKLRKSSARQMGQINKGTSSLTIPRSSGFQSLNFG